ncbi:MAG: DUF5684 domain-containing protein [Planctomycetota bacterium]|nr:DUF5684 domain-containing protein [Planctomycetota bacterium]
MPQGDFLLGQSNSAEAAVGGLFMLIYLGLLAIMVAGMWATFEKANQPGWGVLIPIYNIILLLKVAGKPLWWLILMVIPLVSLIPTIMIPLAVARNFRKGGGFGAGLIFLPFIFYPILGFGSAEYDPEVPAF